MRSTFGCSIHEVGTVSLRWREARALILTAINDGGTYLGAEVRDAEFRISGVDDRILRALVALLSRDDKKAEKHNSRLLLPYAQETRKPKAPSIDAAEYTEATESLLTQFGIDPSIAAADIQAAAARIDNN